MVPVDIETYGVKVSVGSSSQWDANGFVAIQLAVENGELIEYETK